MTELKGIKIEDLNVTKSTFIELIRLLNPDLVIPDDEHIEFSKSYTKGTSIDMMFYHLHIFSDKRYCFTLGFYFSQLGNDFTLTIGVGNNCNTSYLSVDYLFKSEILKPVNKSSTEIAEEAESEPPVEDAEEQDNPEQTEEDAEEEDNPEQTEEDAEEQSEMIDTNMGSMPIEDYHDILAYQHGFDSYEEFKKAWCSDDEEFNTSELKLPPAEENKPSFELTPLEYIIFRERDTCIERYSLFLEKAEEAENDDEYDNCRFDASVAIRIADYLEYIIMEVGLTEKWYSWLAERKKQEVVGASK